MEPMRILAICQHGWPEPHPALSPMEEMVKRGHSVHAVTGMPNYPMGEFFPGYEHNRIKEEDHNGIHITHVPVIARKHDLFHRVLNYYSYPISAKRKLLRLKDEYDVVFATQSSPVMMAEPAIAYGKKRSKKVVVYCMDLWPASLCAGGIKRNSPLYRFYWKLSRKIYRNADLILVTSRMFKEYLISEFDIPEDRIDYLPQSASSVFNDIPQTEKKETTDFVFAGNVGIAQNLGVILQAAKIIDDQNINDGGKKIVFHIVGDGVALESLQAFAKDNQLGNVVFHGRKPPDDMPRYYAMADAMLLTMMPDPIISLTIPAKVQSYMAAGKPILASAEGEVANIIRESRCGFCARADDAQDFVEIIRKFISSEHKTEFGLNAKEYYQKNFAVESVMDKLETVLRDQVH